MADYVGQGTQDIVEFLLNRSHVETLDFDRKIIEAQLLLLEVVLLLLLSLALTAVEQSEDEAAQEIHAHHAIQQVLAPR